MKERLIMSEKENLEKRVEELELELKAIKLQKEIEENQQEQRKFKQKAYGLKWFKFYIYWVPWLTMLYLLPLLTYLDDAQSLYDEVLKSKFTTYFFLTFVITLIYVIFQLIVANNVYEKKEKAAERLKTKIQLGIIIPLIDILLIFMLFDISLAQELMLNMVIALFVGIALYFMNVKYFNERISEFNCSEDFKF